MEPHFFLKLKIKHCNKCALHETSKPVLPYGSIRSIALVGEAPDLVEEQKNVPFTGPSGKLFRSLLSKAGVKFRRLYITNAVKCRSMEGKHPSRKSVHACNKYLEEELLTEEGKNIKIVFSVGKTATLAVGEALGFDLTSDKMGDLVEQVYHIDYDGRKIIVVPLYHPRYIMRKGKPRWMTKQTINSIKEGLDEL